MADYKKLSELRNWKDNPRGIKQDRFEELKSRLKEYGEIKPLIVTPDGEVLGGNMRLKAMQELGFTKAWVSVVNPKTEADKIRIALTDNEEMGYYEDQALAELIEKYKADIDLTKYSVHLSEPISLDDLLQKIDSDKTGQYTLAEKFLVPPFSVLDARLGDWQNRKRQWVSLGIESELGRDSNLSGATEKTSYQSGTNTHVAPSTSIFDPVLCEIAYTWFNIVGVSVLDPFAGGSVRGIVSEKLGHTYTGIDLSKAQIDENYIQADKLDVNPTWLVGDSNIRLDQLEDKYDMIFSCPPYADLEVYSDDLSDLSNMDYKDFREVYQSIITKACVRLKDDRFAVFVVGEARDSRGNYYDFVGDTIKSFINAGMHYYNEMILVTANGTAGMRANRSFQSGRKIVKTHQNVLVFYKGDNKKIRENYGDVEVLDLFSESESIDA